MLLTPCERLHFEGGRGIIGFDVITVSGERRRLQACWKIDRVDTPTHTLFHSLTHSYTCPFVKLIQPRGRGSMQEREVEAQSPHHSGLQSRGEVAGANHSLFQL